MDTYYIGSIIPWPLDYPPEGWLFCNGQQLPVPEYQALFSLITTTYGGNGQTTFALPNLNGRLPVGANMGGAGSSDIVERIGVTGGNENVTLTLNHIPAHTHQATTSMTGLKASEIQVQLPASTASANTDTPTNEASLAVGQDSMGATVNLYTNGQADTALKPVAVTGEVTAGVRTMISVSGSSSPVDLKQPEFGLNFIICVRGLFPPRY